MEHLGFSTRKFNITVRPWRFTIPKGKDRHLLSIMNFRGKLAGKNFRGVGHEVYEFLFWVVVSNIFYFHPYFGEMIQFDEHIFQIGWFNHQLAMNSHLF